MPDSAAVQKSAGPGAWAALGVVYVIWGSTYLGIRLAIDTMPPLLMSGVRFLVAGVVLYLIANGWAIRRRDAVAGEWKSAAIIGFLLLACGNGGVTLSELVVPTGIVSLLVASVPLWIALMTWVHTRSRPRSPQVGAIAVGLLGVGLLVHPTGHASTGQMALTLLAPFCWSLGTMFARSSRVSVRPLVGTGMQMMCGGAALTVAAAVRGEFAQIHVQSISAKSIGALIYLALFGSMLAYTCYVWVLRKLPTPVVATYAYVNPLVAVALGGFFLDEHIESRTILAGGLIIVAVALILALSPRAARAVA